MTLALLTILATTARAFANGGNDVSKGVATLVGSGRASYRRAIGMDKDAGLSSAIVAAGCVLAASFYTLPVSTTHVSTGAIVGAGLRQGRGAVGWRTLGSFVLAWIVTLPAAAVFGGLAAWALAVAS